MEDVFEESELDELLIELDDEETDVDSLAVEESDSLEVLGSELD